MSLQHSHLHGCFALAREDAGQSVYAPLSTRVRPSFAEDSLILFKIPQHDQCLLIPLACDTIGILRGIKHPRAPILQA
jgi:hypothetical protein